MVAPYYADDSVTLHHGGALTILRAMPADSVNCVVTSPPYWRQRDYGGEPGQLGMEKTVGEYVTNMAAIFAEVHRVLADDGTLWLNIGDTYLNNELVGVPWRVSFALSDQGWIRRSEIIWGKRNLKPENVKNRPTQAHEQVFLFAKVRNGYYYDAEAIREESDPGQEAHNRRYAKEYAAHTQRAAATGQPGNVNNVGIHSRPGPGGRNSRTVWMISAQPTPGVHFAVMPPELARRCVAAGSRPGDVVLDPFAGSCTTGMVANQLGRRFVGSELHRPYLDHAMRTRLAQGVLLGDAA